MHWRISLLSTRFQSLLTDNRTTALPSSSHIRVQQSLYRNECTRIPNRAKASVGETAKVSQAEAFLETLEEGNSADIDSNDELEALRTKVCFSSICILSLIVNNTDYSAYPWHCRATQGLVAVMIFGHHMFAD